MSNRRPNSCPDAWKYESDMCEDRPRSVLGMQNKEDSKHENSEFSASENNALNKGKVNSWIPSKGKEKFVPSDPSGGKLFHHHQRRVSPAVSSETSGTTRPHTEPGRTRNQMFSGDVKTLPRQSVHDVASGSTGTRTEKAKLEDDWVMVEKSTSEIDMSSDPEDETNVLVPSPKKSSEETKENLEREKLERTKMVVANKFGSAFEVSPAARDKTSSGTWEEPNASSETKTKLLNVASQKPGKMSIANIMTFATSITKWKQRKATIKTGFATLDPEHRELLAAESVNMKTEIPEAMMITIKEEAYKIVLKTTQAYRSQIGSKHRLTTEAFEYLKDLREELNRT